MNSLFSSLYICRVKSDSKAQKNNELRFELLVRALSTSTEPRRLPQAVCVSVFLNAILASAFEFDERVLLRGEMIKAGIIEAIETVRASFGLTAVNTTLSFFSYIFYLFSPFSPPFSLFFPSFPPFYYVVVSPLPLFFHEAKRLVLSLLFFSS